MIEAGLPWLSRRVFKWPATHPSPPQIKKTFSDDMIDCFELGDLTDKWQGVGVCVDIGNETKQTKVDVGEEGVGEFVGGGGSVRRLGFVNAARDAQVWPLGLRGGRGGGAATQTPKD